MSQRRLPGWVPARARRVLARARVEAVSMQTRAAVRRLLGSPRPVILGPWLGEVGFELLYWVPFLRWAVAEADADPRRLVAVSRGGAEPWYAGIAGHYCDAFDTMSADGFRTANRRRQAELGEQKQIRSTAVDEGIVESVRKAIGEPGAAVLHPSLMYRVMFPYWWTHVPASWVPRHAAFERLARHDAALPPDLRAGEYVAVKFYFNDCFPATPDNRAYAADVTRAIAARHPVVSLSTGLSIDDHEGPGRSDNAMVRTIEALTVPRNNLAVQHAIVAGARAFVGTYGGFAYLAPFCGVPAVGVYADPDGFDRSHLDAAQQAFRAIGTGPLALAATAEASPEQAARMVAAP